MTRYSSDVAFTPIVKAIQQEKGSRVAYGKMEQRGGWQTRVTPELDAFLARLDMFYLGTANAEGQPYIQYRGGPPGLLRVVDEQTLAFADFGGNRQYITLGNLRDNPKAFLFLMDYEGQQRIKVWGKARVVEDDPRLLQRLTDKGYPARVERAIVFAIQAWDANCPQHIHRRLPESKVQAEITRLQQQIRELKARLGEA
ncbi:MAG: pyridoxamine 5'-phosphate oxidase family protein [Pirellulales bacterium]|nr:pyridoxamine 5'-phosphate oxidase family protein [Pirellulales bacterium]